MNTAVYINNSRIKYFYAFCKWIGKGPYKDSNIGFCVLDENMNII